MARKTKFWMTHPEKKIGADQPARTAGSEEEDGGRPLTLSDLAEELGLSVASVSQALNPRNPCIKLKKETIERVRAHAKARKYRPHTGARSIRSQRFQSVGYFILKPSRHAYEFTDYAEGIGDAALEADYNVIDVRVPRETSTEGEMVPKALRENTVDALIVANLGGMTAALAEAIEESLIPTVFLNEKRETNSIYIDDVEGARIATSHLLSKGVKRITFLAHGPHNESTIPHYSLRDREAGYREMMTAAGLEPHVVVTDPSRPKEILNILSGRNHPEGFVCYNDILANLLLRTAYALRMSVPDDFLVIGYDDEFLASQSVVPLTSMRIPFYRAGTEAFKFAARLVEGADPIPSRMFVPELVVRDSTSR